MRRQIASLGVLLVLVAETVAAPVPSGATPPPDLAAPLAYKDLMIVLVAKDGAAAVVFHDPQGAGVSYRFRYESADGKVVKTGEGKVLEKRLNGGAGGYDETLLDIKAGPIAVRWSAGGPQRGWIYYSPETIQVHLAHAKNFEDNIPIFGDSRIEEKLDLKRFLRK